MKKDKFILNRGLMFGGLFVVILVVVVIVINVSNKDEILSFKNEWEKLNNVATENGEKYPRVIIPEDNKFKYTTYDKLIDGINNREDMVVFLGYPSCLYCRTAMQVLVNTSQEMDIESILYLDVSNKDDKYNELLGILGDHFVDPEENSKIYSPSVIFVANGNIVSYHKGTLFSQETPYDELDKSQIDGLSEIYRYGIQDVIYSMD